MTSLRKLQDVLRVRRGFPRRMPGISLFPGRMPGLALFPGRMPGLLWLLIASHAWAGQNVVIVLDDSGSMSQTMQHSRQTRIDAAKGALSAVLGKLADDASVGVVALNSGSRQRWLIPLGPVAQGQVQQAVDRIQAGGDTPLGACMKMAADRLLAWRAEQKYGDYRLLIVTDGEANDQQLVERYLPEILARGLTVDVIGVDMRQDHSLATSVHAYRRADDAASLEKAVAESVLGETTVDAGDAGRSDFELLNALPDEMASTLLTALTAQSNAPIGAADDQVDDALPLQGGRPFPVQGPNAADDPATESGPSAFLCALIALALLMFLAAKLRSRL